MQRMQDLLADLRRDAAVQAKPLDAATLDLLLYSPCPVKLAVKAGIDRIVENYAARGEELGVHIPMGCTSIDPYDPVCRETDPDKLPAMIASIGYGDFWKKPFVERFVATGLFEAPLPARVNPLHEQAGLVDPSGAYLIYGVTPYIFLADTQRLGGLPVPRVWEELLDPIYRGHIVMCGDGDDMADAVLLNLYKEHGLDGIKRLVENVRGFMHSSTMAVMAGKDEKNAGSIYIIPSFFAESTKRPERVLAIWPEDGAAASPLYVLVKKSERERLAELTAFFSHGFGEIPSAAWFVPVDADAASPLPPEARLKWVGWDFVAANDVNALRDRLALEFQQLRRGAACAS
jgi:ABC-type Fe3+ transport system substrate-binding protein